MWRSVDATQHPIMICLWKLTANYITSQNGTHLKFYNFNKLFADFNTLYTKTPRFQAHNFPPITVVFFLFLPLNTAVCASQGPSWTSISCSCWCLSQNFSSLQRLCLFQLLHIYYNNARCNVYLYLIHILISPLYLTWRSLTILALTGENEFCYPQKVQNKVNTRK